MIFVVYSNCGKEIVFVQQQKSFVGDDLRESYRVVAGEIAGIETGEVRRLQSAFLPVTVGEYTGAISPGY